MERVSTKMEMNSNVSDKRSSVSYDCSCFYRQPWELDVKLWNQVRRARWKACHAYCSTVKYVLLQGFVEQYARLKRVGWHPGNKGSKHGP